MSNHWDIKCETCNVKMDLSLNHGDSRIAEILGAVADMQPAQAQSFLALYQAVTDVDTIDMGYYTDRAFSLTWLAEHAGHDLRAADEYGFVGEPVVSPRRMAWDEYLDLRSQIRRAPEEAKAALVTKALELARLHDFDILLPMANGHLTPEAARDLGNSIARFLDQHQVIENRAQERARVEREGTEAERRMWGDDEARIRSETTDRQDLERLRGDAESLIRAVFRGLNNHGKATP